MARVDGGADPTRAVWNEAQMELYQYVIIPSPGLESVGIFLVSEMTIVHGDHLDIRGRME